MLKEWLYRLLGRTASRCFHLMNMLMGGNLPPFGSVCAVIRDGERYLVLSQSHGKTVLPGGFMRWQEDPLEAVLRECREETGLQVRVDDLIGCFSCPSHNAWRMSTLTLVYSVQVAGGQLRQAVEGRPLWYSEAEALEQLEPGYQRFFAGYLRHTQRTTEFEQGVKVASLAPISERL